MKLDTIVAIVILIRFSLSFLWFVVEFGQKGHCHGQLDERRLQFLLDWAAQVLCVYVYVQS
jgi:hypothetical protein